MAEAAAVASLSGNRFVRWAGRAALLGSLVFIALRLASFDWPTLRPHLSASLVAGTLGAAGIFALADRALAEAWAGIADPDHRHMRSVLIRIYARGTLFKYVPGTIFQYVSRQLEGARLGLAHRELARSALIEIALHLASSASAALVFLLLDISALAATTCAALAALAARAVKRPMSRAFLYQLAAFLLFGAAAALIGAILLPPDAAIFRFAAVFLLAWLAGFCVPVAPGGIGIREAVLLALAGAMLPAAGLVAAVLALRVASVGGDLLFSAAAMLRRADQ